MSPFRERARDFNVWALAVPTQESGVSRPSTGVHHASPLGTRYDIFGSERYVLTLDNRALRDMAQYAPYEFIEILVNNDTYGGGGIFGQFSTAAASNDGPTTCSSTNSATISPAWPTSTTPRRWPTRPARGRAVGAERHRAAGPGQLKWKHFVKPGTALPTPWPKAEYERRRASTSRRAALRAANRPEAEINALFHKDLACSNALFSTAPHRKVGAFEGANYEATGYYRPDMQCMMFDPSETFCQVCRAAIGNIIDLYAGQKRRCK